MVEESAVWVGRAGLKPGSTVCFAPLSPAGGVMLSVVEASGGRFLAALGMTLGARNDIVEGGVVGEVKPICFDSSYQYEVFWIGLVRIMVFGRMKKEDRF